MDQYVTADDGTGTSVCARGAHTAAWDRHVRCCDVRRHPGHLPGLCAAAEGSQVCAAPSSNHSLCRMCCIVRMATQHESPLQECDPDILWGVDAVY